MGHRINNAKTAHQGTAALALAGIVALFSPKAHPYEVWTISARPKVVSGGDVLVQVFAPKRSRWSVQLNGNDVTASFRVTQSSGDLVALLTGLHEGRNRLVLRVGARLASSLEIVNHPRSGPIFSGPHQVPFICQTEVAGLGPATDGDCSANTLVQYYYKSSDEAASDVVSGDEPKSTRLGFKPYNLSAPPSDIAQTTTSDGRTLNFIVRREIGTINRAVYEIQYLHQPGSPLPTPWDRSSPGWNGRLIYNFGAGCEPGNRQGTLAAQTLADELLLGSGYALATSTLNAFSNGCNDRVSAETLTMVKEYFIEHFGPPEYTIGVGGSGGAIQQYLIAQNYPGLIDGIIAAGSFPDIPTFIQSSMDCPLLNRAFKKSNQHWSERQKTAVAGFATWRTCASVITSFEKFSIRPHNCNPVVPGEMIYDPALRPKGLRCDIYSNEIAVFGRDPRTGLARRPLDNIGVQYGLAAFNSGIIDTNQFIELNEYAGGYDEDGTIVSTRTAADPETFRLAYERGLIFTGGGEIGAIPIIDWRSYTDDQADNHDRFRSLATRMRLIAAHGNADNQVIVVFPRPELLPSLAGNYPDLAPLARDYSAIVAERGRNFVEQMDEWLHAIRDDRAGGTLSERISRNRPKELADGCWSTGGTRVTERMTYNNQGKCNELYPVYSNPRIVAGAPITDDVLKCALKEINSADYTQTLHPVQLERLRAVFPSGVCDYSQPGIGQQLTRETWQYADEPHSP